MPSIINNKRNGFLLIRNIQVLILHQASLPCDNARVPLPNNFKFGDSFSFPLCPYPDSCFTLKYKLHLRAKSFLLKVMTS